MKPVLYESTETSFTSNGLGRLSDAMSCNAVEERNGAYELTMKYPVTGIHFAELAQSRIIYAVPADGKGPQPFRIYYISKPLNETVEVKAEHISYQLSHIPVQPFTAGNCAEAMAGLKTYSAESNPFTFWTDKTTVAPFSVKTPSSIRSLLGGTNGSILDAFGGGEYEFDQYTVKLHNSRGSDNNVQLKYGKNITDIKQEENIGSTYTGVYPYWLGTVDNVETLITLPEKVLHSANAQNFPYQRTIPLDLSSEFESQPTEAQLRTKAQAYMAANNIGVPNINIEVNFIALWQTEEYKQFANLERVNLCDTVTVEFPLLGISAKAKVVKTDYDVLKERYNSIEVGDVRTKLATQITQATNEAVNALAQIVPTKSFLQQAVDHATQLITGGLGGHVVFTLNADGEPEEILIMDTDDIQTAVNVIRMNVNGIGFSTNGYQGPFTTAWTIDGRFNADFITAGAIDAALITAGFLSADRIQGGTLTVGGANNGNGQVIVKDANGNTIGTIDNTGANIVGNITMKSANGAISAGLRTAYIMYWPMGINPMYSYAITGLDLRLAQSSEYWRTISPQRDYRYHEPESSSSSEYGHIMNNYTHAVSYYKNGLKYYMFNERYGEVYSMTIMPLNAAKEIDLTQPDTARVSVDGSIGMFVISDEGIGFCNRNFLVSGSSENMIKSVLLNLSTASNAAGFIINPNVFKVVSGTDEFRMANGTATINGNTIQFASSGSSKRFKNSIKDISDDALDPHRLLKLRVVQFKYNKDHPLQYDDMRDKLLPGFIAEEVEENYPSAVIHDRDGKIKDWDERRIIPGMLSLIQEQQKAIAELKNRVEILEAQLKMR